MKNKDEQKKKKRRGNFCYDFVKITGILPALIWLRPKVYRPFGKKVPKGGFLLCANHVTMIDPIIVHLAMPNRRLYSLATKDLCRTKIGEAFFERMHCIMIDKQNVSMDAIRTVIERLREGKVVVIFPEGEVNHKEGRPLMAFKDGAVLMAHRANAPILPMYIEQRAKWCQRQRIVVGEPIDVRAMVGAMPSMAQLSTVSEHLHEKEEELRAICKAKGKMPKD